MNSSEILILLRSGQTTPALKELYKAYPAIRQFIKTHGGNEDDAKDCFQDALMILYRNALKPEFELTASVNTYLYSVCRFLWKDQLKKKNRESDTELKDIPMEDISTALQQEEEAKFLQQVLSKLGQKCSEILQLFYYEKKNMEEIAQELGYTSVDSAKTQKYKCLERAKQMASEINFSSTK